MITPFYASLLALIYLVLTVNVIKKRRKYLIGLGFGKSEPLTRAVRAHGNFFEYIPFLLLLMYFAEIQNMNGFTLHLLGVCALISRLFHAYGITKSAGKSWGRVIGMATNFTVYFILIGFNLYKTLPSLF